MDTATPGMDAKFSHGFGKAPSRRSWPFSACHYVDLTAIEWPLEGPAPV